MTETVTAGATGAPDKLDLEQYKHAIKSAPELLFHLAHLVTPGAYSDGQPTAKDMQAAPGRLAPLDELEAVFTWLWREAGAWIGQARLDEQPIAHMVRRNDRAQVIGTRWIVTDEHGADGLLRDAQHLVGIIMRAWPTIETRYRDTKWGEQGAQQWISDVDEHLLRPIARWPLDERTAVPERARRCPVCGEDGIFTQFVDTSRGTVMCARCQEVAAPEAWLPVRDVAGMLGVAERTVRDWVAGGLEHRKTSKGREVELGAARAERDYREARKKMSRFRHETC